MTNFLTQVQGFTPLIEVMVQEVGIIQAAVYGVVWRYCQRRDGVCTASHETLGAALGLSRGTVQRHIKELCEAGYLRDTTPERKNRPHVYADTGRAQIVGMVSAKVTVSEKYSGISESDAQVYQKDTRRDCETTEETHGADAPLAPAEATDEPQTILGLKIAKTADCKNCGYNELASQMVDGRCENCHSEMLIEKLHESGRICKECGKPQATTTEMPYVGKVCICPQEAAFVEAFGDPPERLERKPPPHWREQVKDERALWGFSSPEFQRQLAQYGDAGRKVRLLGYDWEQLTQLEPDWEDKQAIKSWSSGLWACLKAAGGDASIVLDATRKAIEDGLTISDPYSAVKVTQALCGERKRGPQQRSGMGSGIVYA